MNTQSREPISLDGTTLEGGGQLLRLSLALSSLTSVPFHITDIRGKRGPLSKPGKDGGMKQAHLVGAQWLEAVTNATVKGMELKSRDMTFAPTTFISPVKSPQNASTESKDTKPLGSVWKNIYDGSKLIRRESRISMTTPGSIFLVLQAILPYVLFASVGSEDDRSADTVPVHMTITGGTNVWHSLSYEYADQVLFPMLYRIGLGPIQMKLRKRGWSMGTNSIGEVSFDITPLKPGAQLPAFSFTSRGDVSKIHVSILAPNLPFRTGIKKTVIENILHHYPDVDIEFPVDVDSRHDKRAYLLLVAETTNGYRLGRDWLFDERINRDVPQKTISRLVSKVVKDLWAELSHEGCVDEYLQDQLVVFQALGKGASSVLGSTPSLHTQTARWVTERLVGVGFDDNGTCNGIGLVAGGERHEGQEQEAQKVTPGEESITV